MLKEDAMIVGGIALGVIALAWYAKNKIGDAAEAVWDGAASAVPYVNPADERNVVNQGFMKAYQWATGSNSSLGSDIYDATHGGNLDLSNPNAAIQKVNPASSNNVINQGFNSLYQSITGSKGTLGSDIYDWTH